MRAVIRTLILTVFAGLTVAATFAAEPPKTVSLSPEALGAKAFLEGLIVRRFSQELGTQVDQNSFTLGAQIELISIAPILPTVPTPTPTPAPEQKAETEPFSDLMLGALDPDHLMRLALPPPPNVDEKPAVQKVLEKFRVRSVLVSIGLSDELNPQVKGETEQWLKKRLQAEFGAVAKGAVTFIKKKTPEKKVEEQLPKDVWEWMTHYENLAGQIIMAGAILVGIILWQLLSRFSSAGADAGFGGVSSSEDESDFAALSEAAAEIQAEQEKENKKTFEFEERERNRANADIERLKIRLRELVPRLSGYFEDVVRTWCHMGEIGRMRLACFAEAAGQETGKLPIPVDALPDVQKVFARMPEVSLKEKREALEKAYWDLLSTLNLGSDSLTQPFSYVDGLSMNMLKRVLMDQNPRLKTLVSLYMSNDLRGRFMKSLSVNAKKELLAQAAQMSEISSDELETLDRGLMARINPTRGQEIVPLEMSLQKLVDTLTPSEQVTMLSDMNGDAIEDYKRIVPSLAFLSSWPDDKLKLLMMGITPDELISFLRVRPDLKQRMLGLASMMVGEIAGEELAKPDKTNPLEHDKNIEFFTSRLKTLVEQGDINLGDVFGPKPGASVDAISTDGDGPDGSKRVA